ncbi:Pup deamidase/depupylase [Planctomycetes bacterium K23_9]|uniref:Pup deamidase/depupylase n=2 Tax=Stieleria marina TaxID=1930275 RepID=A0A517NST9_9BACT|nr:Pup deamidase/depupylase [Planctomycetes bacterium K23_9]
METEYATLVANPEHIESDELPTSQSIYQAICEAIRRDQPTGEGLYDKEQMFLASGGAVTFESHPTLHSLPGGLIEIATPEVHSPDELLACQRSIDALIADAAATIVMDVDLRVLKNSSDAFGHVYGCQENYDCIVASGAWLVLYRFLVALLWCFQIASLLLSLPVLASLFLLGLIYRKLRRFLPSRRSPAADQSAPDASSRSPDASSQSNVLETAPAWLIGTVVGLFRIIHFPTVLLLKFLVKRIAFRKQRKYLTAFLYSRVALCGTGVLGHDGCFTLSAKAMAIDKLSDLGGFRGERPVFVFGHWLTQFCAKSFHSLSSTASMFHRRQRLQIGLSDSNLAELPEYVKVGATSLLLDMIDSGDTDAFPCMSRRVDPLHCLASDWNLVTRTTTSHGELSALEIQKKYLAAAQAFVEQTDPGQRGEATLVLQRWQQLYDSVLAFRRDANAMEQSIGQVDWLTKKWLIQQLGTQADWSAKKKIDLRYHELSREGYFFKLLQYKPERRLISAARIDRRRRSPPPDSPAARRGWLIREFASSDQAPQFDWSHAMIGVGQSRKRIEFIQQNQASTGRPSQSKQRGVDDRE